METPKPSKKQCQLGRSCKKCGADRWRLSHNKIQSFYQCVPCSNRHKVNWMRRHSKARREFGWRDRRINMKIERYQEMEREQGYACALCHKPTQKMVVDHDHKTGLVRGLLCRRCNVLAQEPETLWAALSYVERFRVAGKEDSHATIGCI